VLISGDLFELHNHSASLVSAVCAWLRNLAAQRITVLIIPDNDHSYWYEQPVSRRHDFPSNTHVFTEASCEQPFQWRVVMPISFLYDITHDHTRERHPLESLKLPLIFDDSCARFDAERLAATAEFQLRIPSGRQVIILIKNESLRAGSSRYSACKGRIRWLRVALHPEGRTHARDGRLGVTRQRA